MMNKRELINWLTEEQQKWELLLAAIGEERLAQPGVDSDWSLCDMIAHLTGWHRWLVIRMQAAADGQPTPMPPWPADLTSDDAINAWIYETNQQQPVHTVLQAARAAHEQLMALLHTLPEASRIESIEGKFHLIWIRDQRFEAGEFFHHFYDDHAADVYNWLGPIM